MKAVDMKIVKEAKSLKELFFAVLEVRKAYDNGIIRMLDFRGLPKFCVEQPPGSEDPSVLSWDSTHLLVTDFHGAFGIIPVGCGMVHLGDFRKKMEEHREAGSYQRGEGQ
jgi:hypothetical protein